MIRDFDSFEEAQAAIAAGVASAKAMIHPFQWPLADGGEHYFLKLYSFDLSRRLSDILLICGRIWSLAEQDMTTDQYVRDGVIEEDEASREKITRRAMLADGFAFGTAYSMAEPDGEMGDIHISTCLEIDRIAFENYRALGWDLLRAKANPDSHGPILQWIKDVHYQ